jgi:rhodanese-related sulfurtransferase
MLTFQSLVSAQVKTVNNIGQEEFLQLQKDKKVVVIDVRTPEETAQGVIKGAVVFADVNAPDFAAKIAALDTNKTYLVYCRSGARSSNAAQYMISKGFTKVYNLKGGISNWKGEIVKK